MTQTRDIQTALETFRQHGGVMRTSQALMRGIEPHPIDGVPVRIYSVARTIVDCFKNVVASVLARLRNVGRGSSSTRR